jgi:hypothetical protein
VPAEFKDEPESTAGDRGGTGRLGARLVACELLGSHWANNFRSVCLLRPSRVLASTGSQSSPGTGPGGTTGMAIFPGPTAA